MTEYLFLLIIVAYAVAYWIISMIRIGKLRRLQEESGHENTLIQALQKNRKTLGILLILCTVLAASSILFPSLQTYFAPLRQMQLRPVQYTGFALVKLSFIWLIASQFEISRIIDQDVSQVPKRILKITRTEVIGICLLSLGIFLGLPSFVSLILFLGPLLLLKPVK